MFIKRLFTNIVRILHLEIRSNSHYYKYCIRCGYHRLLGHLMDYELNDWTFEDSVWKNPGVNSVNCLDEMVHIIKVMND